MGRVGVSIRGAEPRHTLILVDGQPVMGDLAKYQGAGDELQRLGTEIMTILKSYKVQRVLNMDLMLWVVLLTLSRINHAIKQAYNLTLKEFVKKGIVIFYLSIMYLFELTLVKSVR